MEPLDDAMANGIIEQVFADVPQPFLTTPIFIRC